MELFPFIDSKPIENTPTTLPLYQDIAWDYINDKPIVENGTFKVVQGKEAVKSWAFRALRTIRYKYEIFSWNYGHEIESVINKHFTADFTRAEVIRYIQEAVSPNEYITGISNVSLSFTDYMLTINFKLNTIYGESEVTV